ncbi:hypothetical protein KUL152_32660 [Tenacibaculum sp. KUL152]|nr:hypothetical protein KUL152_32660 [Tenacibaculum sp. KUL152]GFD94600.1 hypothetical protein KUL154_33330 [Alteromonas sp. KUL154]GFE01610.1 hypothetical protein KUL156_42020 [Alteromonas sp. KUL156]
MLVAEVDLQQFFMATDQKAVLAAFFLRVKRIYVSLSQKRGVSSNFDRTLGALFMSTNGEVT